MPFTQPAELEEAAASLEVFFLTHPPRCCWSRGAFDYPILAKLMAEQDVPIPWQYWQLRDVRTLDDLVPKVKP